MSNELRTERESYRQTPIAIVGMGCLFPNARDIRAYWRLLRRCEDAVREVPPTHWLMDDYVHPDKVSGDFTYCGRGAFLPSVDFDPTEFGIPPTVLEATDTAQLLALKVAKAALCDAGYGGDREFDRSRASVLLGVTGTQELVISLGARMGHPFWRKAMLEAGIDAERAESIVDRIADQYVSWQENSFPGLLGNVVAGRIANRLDLRGTNCVVDAACASSLSAVHLALMELAAGRSDMVLTGGVDALNDIFMYMCFSKTQALSPTGDARPFSGDADGTVLGEGVGMLVLKRLDDAQRDGDRVYATIRGVGTASDGRSQSIYAPRAGGQADALRDAYKVSGIDPSTVELVEAHGTGTKVGDAVEFEALKTVYRESQSEGKWCALGSVKSQIGHTKAAAGVAGLIKAALAVHHKVLPPTLKVSRPNESMGLDASPFYLNTNATPWTKHSEHPRRAAVSSFGFGGSNFHAVVEEAPIECAQPAWDGSVMPIAFSADAREVLLEQVAEWIAFVAGDAREDQIAHRACVSRRGFSADLAYRLVVVVEKGDDVAVVLKGALELVRSSNVDAESSDGNVFYGCGVKSPKVAFLFPGQASQYVGMGRDLFCVFPEAHRAIEESDAGVEYGDSLSARIFPHATFDRAERARQEADLTRTDVAQPAIGTVALAAMRVLERFGVRPDISAGHSYGELVALRSAGRIDDAALLALSRVRGALMADSTVARGAMAAVSAPVDALQEMVDDAGLDVVLAHRNTPKQGVLSGAPESIDAALKCCAQKGWPSTRLNVSGAFHSPLMSSARDRFRDALATVSIDAGARPVYANATSEVFPDDADAVRDSLANQFVQPVDFVGLVRRLHGEGVTHFVEVGPKNVLTKLVRAILPDIGARVVSVDVGQSGSGLTQLARVLGGLAVAGCHVKLDEWEPDVPEPRQPRMVVPLVGANYRNPKNRVSRVQACGSDRLTQETNTVKRSVPTNGSAAPGASISEPLHPVAQHVRPASAAAPLQSSVGGEVLQVVQEGLRAMQKLQEQTADAHKRFLEGQELAQKTFQMVLQEQHRIVHHTMGHPVSPPAYPAVAARSPETSVSDPSGVVGAREALVGAVAAAVPPVASEGNGHLGRVESALLKAVSETTGYPIDSVHLDMDLESDLGIDSVRRNALLARLGEYYPQAAAIAPDQSYRLTTLRQIAEHAANGNGHVPAHVGGNGTSQTEASASPTPATVDQAESGSAELAQTLLEVVAHLTGYPIEMLDCDMDMEADLGIDSIKRVEILAEVQTRMPGLKEVDSSYMGSMRTLRNIIDYLDEQESPGGAVGGNGHVQAAPATQPQPAQDREVAVSPVPVATSLDRRVLRVKPLSDQPEAGVLPLASGREVLIVGDDALATALRDRLSADGVSARRASWKSTRKKSKTEIGGLILVASGASTEAASAKAGSAEALTKMLKEAFAVAKSCGADLCEAAGEGGAFLATVTRMDGAFGLRGGAFEPLQGGLAGLAKTVGCEWSEVRVRAFDVDPQWKNASEAADAIVRTLGTTGPTEIGLSADGRCSLELAAGDAPSGDIDLSQGDVVLVSGGARGVTAEAVMSLASFKPVLVLFGRSPEPEGEPQWLSGLTGEAEIKRAVLEHEFRGQATPTDVRTSYNRIMAGREIRRQIGRMERAGASVVYRSLDIRDARAVRAEVADIRASFGSPRMLVHGAGVLHDRAILDKTPEQFDNVFDTKIVGLLNLLDATKDDDLRAIGLFSSVSGRFGRRGQIDYAMANECVNKLARRLAADRPKCRVVALNWGPWDGGMVDATLRAEFEREGVGLIPLDAGSRAFGAELAQRASGDVEVVLGAGFDGLMDGGLEDDVQTRSVPALPVAYERRLDLDRHEFLRSHVFASRPVLPIAVMVEWLGHAALHDHPGLILAGLDDFRLFGGVVVDQAGVDLSFAAGRVRKTGDLFEVDVELASVDVDVELASVDAPTRRTVHARATALLSSVCRPADNSRAERIEGNGAPIPSDPYDAILFHGPHFHTIERITCMSREGIAAQVRSAPSPSAWMTDPLRSEWLGDPLVVDAALQLGIVWAHQHLGAGALPSRIGRIRFFRSVFPAEGVSVALRVVDASRHALTADASILDAAGVPIAQISRCVWTVDPSLADAFCERSLAGASC